MTFHLASWRLATATFLLVTIMLAGGAIRTENVQRFGAVIGVNPEKLEYYKELHAKPWPTINAALKKANIRNYSIYLTQFDDGNWYLFSYLEYVGSDYQADMKRLGEDPETQRWLKETDPCQIGLKNRQEGEWWKSIEEVYHLD